jgi:hypothetical protein
MPPSPLAFSRPSSLQKKPAFEDINLEEDAEFIEVGRAPQRLRPNRDGGPALVELLDEVKRDASEYGSLKKKAADAAGWAKSKLGMGNSAAPSALPGLSRIKGSRKLDTSGYTEHRILDMGVTDPKYAE